MTMTQVGDSQQENDQSTQRRRNGVQRMPIVPRHGSRQEHKRRPTASSSPANIRRSTSTHEHKRGTQNVKRGTQSVKRGTPAPSHAFSTPATMPPHNPRPSTPAPHPSASISSRSGVLFRIVIRIVFVSSNRESRVFWEWEARVVEERQSRMGEGRWRGWRKRSSGVIEKSQENRR